MFLSSPVSRLTKNEKCKFLLIKDTSQNNGRKLMQALAVLHAKEDAKVSYLTYDLPRDRISKTFCLDEPNFKVFDAFSDPFNWRRSDSSPDFTSCHILRHFCDDNTAAVFIDSMYSLLSENSVKSVYRSIYNFINNSASDVHLIALLHSDCHPAEDVSILESVATTILELVPSENNCHCICSTIRHASGKVTREILECQIDGSGKIVMMKEIPPFKLHEGVQKRPDPTANLTFNLKLKDDEKENREKVQLPYAEAQSKNLIVDNTTFLEDDFYDEEDPDDDLDI